MGWLHRLQERWNVGNVWQVVSILIVFACTGLTVVAVMRPTLHFFFGPEIPMWGKVLYYILILPIYNLVLLFYGFIFGQFRFFWEFEKRFFKRMRSVFQKK
jgi:hypothetical protein